MGNGFNYVFDATQYKPEQSPGAHPVGKFVAMISNTELKPIKDDPEGRPRFVVEFTTEAGKIHNGYNLWSASMQAVDISHKQLSALSHVTGVFRIDFNNEGAALRGQRCVIEVGKQKDSDYVEVKRVFDINGNEPGVAPQQPQQAPQQPVQQTAPQPNPAPTWGAQNPAAQQPQPNSPWGNQPQQGAPQGQPQQGWNGQQPQQAPQPVQQQAPNWQQQPQNTPDPNAGSVPAWARPS